MSRRQTVFFLPIHPRDKGHQDPAQIDFTVPRRAQYLHSAWKKHQDAVFWVDINLAIRKGMTFYQTRSNAIILEETLPAYCIPKVVRLKCMRNHTCLLDHHQRSHYDTITIGPEGMFNWVLELNNSQSVKLSDGHVEKFYTQRSPNQPNQSPDPICDRSGRPDSTEDVFVVKGETSRSHEIDEKGFHGELCSSDRSGKPDNLFETTRVEQTHDGSGQPDERNSSSAHTVKEQFAPEDNRDIALFNTDNELTVQSTRRTSPSTFQDYHFLQ